MPQYQSSLGRVGNDDRKDMKMGGYTAIGRVTKVHHKRNTADVKLVRTGDMLTSLDSNEGKYSCKILMSNARFDIATGKSSGVIEPVTEGELVIIAFIEGLKSQPIILGSIHRMDNTDNILSSQYPIAETNKRERLKFLRVFPSQDYMRVDGEGNMELSAHGKSFIKYDEEELSDDNLGFDAKDLLEKDKFTGNTLSMEDSSYHKPKNLLAVFRDNWNDSATTWTKLLIKSDGMTRLSRNNKDDTLTFVEVAKNGALTLKRQLDTAYINQSDNYSEVSIKQTGELEFMRKNGGIETTIRILENNNVSINVNNNISIEFKVDGTININASKAINMTAPIININ